MLLERERELALIERVLDGAVDRDARVVMIEGEAGVGKSTLLARAGERGHARGLRVLDARGGVLERTLGFGVARQLFERDVVRASAAARRSLLSGSAAVAAPVLGIGESVGAAGADATVGGDFPFLHGLYWLVANLCERTPVLLLVDDGQWCDDSTLRWLLYLARRIEGLRAAVIVAVRSGEPDAPRALLDSIAAEPVSEGVALGPLGLDATATLLERACGAEAAPEFSRACFEATGGNPLFVSELASEVVAEGLEPSAATVDQMRELTPDGLSRVTLLRLSRLGAASVDLARAVATLESAELRHAAELAGLDEQAAIRAADELAGARILAGGSPLRFAHPLIAGVVYGDVPRGRRSADHKRAAQVLAKAGSDPGRVALQLLRTDPGGEEWVVDELIDAAARELARGSAATAAALLRRAVSEPPGRDALAQVLLKLGVAESLAGEPTAVESLRSALEASVDPHERGTIALQLGPLLLRAGRTHEAVTMITPVADDLGWGDEDLRLQLEATIIGTARIDIGFLDVIQRRLELVGEHANSDTHGGRLIAVQLSWGMTAVGAPVSRAVELARRGLADGRLIAEAPTMPDAYLIAIHMLSICDELDDAERYCAQAVALAQEYGSEPVYAGIACFRSWAALHRGRLQDAELYARDALAVTSDMQDVAVVVGLAKAFLAVALTERGEAEQAIQLLGPDVAALASSPLTWVTDALFAAGRAHVAVGSRQAGLELLLACGRRCIAWGVKNPAWLPWRSETALTLFAIGDTAEAISLSDEELRRARRFGARRPLGVALRACGLIAGGDQGLQLLRESARVLDESPARLERARTLVALGGALRRANARVEARETLQIGLELARTCGATTLAGDAVNELQSSGARPRRMMFSGADALTASERRVCEMAGRGMSNPEIAQSLFVTRGTVESHLHSAYSKLDITSRNQLTGALAAT
jgi:DNA-binding CsgD family transcriptional regulator